MEIIVYKNLNENNCIVNKFLMYNVNLFALWFAYYRRDNELNFPVVYDESHKNGEIIYEWINQEKKLNVYISKYEIVFVKVWGSFDEWSEDGVINKYDTIFELWKWIYK